jgi:hypothetical protein
MSKWKGLLKNLAPTLATALGGPLAGTATKFLAESLIGDKDAPEAAIEAAMMNASPQELARIKEIDSDFAIEMAKIDIDVFEMEVKDRQGARDMAKVNMWPQIVLSTVFIGGYFGVIYMLFSGSIKIDPSIRDMSNILLGVMTANIPSIMAFWFGSSHGSKQKSSKP